MIDNAGYTMPFLLDDEVCLKIHAENKNFYDQSGKLMVFRVDGIFVYQIGTSVADDGITKIPVPGFKYRIVRMGHKMEVKASELISKKEFKDELKKNAYSV